MKNTIIITGGAGFIGSNLIELLLEKTSKKIANCTLSVNKNASPDKRSYKVDFSKYNNLITIIVLIQEYFFIDLNNSLY